MSSALSAYQKAQQLRRLVRSAHDQTARATGRVDNEPFEDFFRRISPDFEYPLFLGQIIDAIEKSQTEPVRVVISCPPQHGKTELIKHLLAWLLATGKKRHAYLSYNVERGEKISHEIQNLADAAGIPWEGKRGEWRTPWGSALRATGIGGGLTGYPIDGVCVVDDPVKDWKDACSAGSRDDTDEWFQTVAGTRRHLTTSYIIVQTRWHEDDLAGRLIKRGGWVEINIPAINAAGEALCPSRFPLSLLSEIQADIKEFFWSALYMGRPVSLDGRIFGDITTYTNKPDRLRVGIGVDLAYSLATSRDYTAYAVMGYDPLTKITYLLDGARKQCRAPEFASTLTSLKAKYPNAPIWWYCNGPESGTADLLRVIGLPVTAKNVGKDGKYVRATQRYSPTWNDGKVQIPKSGERWVDEFVTSHLNFTGRPGDSDDYVDAACAAYDACNQGQAPWKPIVVGNPSQFPSWRF